MKVCAVCGEQNPDKAKFCLECGGALEAPSPRREERRVVTVLFADLVGFTSRSERMDVEDVRGTLGPYHELLRRELESYGATVEKFIGDAVMALFGAPTAHEDDPERAVRAALAIQDAVAELRDREPELDLRVRVGVNTGEALVVLDADPRAGEGMASGDVVNTAARLQSAAPVDGVVVGELTYRATDRVIDYEPGEPVSAKGKAEPVPVWCALQARSIVPEQARRDDLPLVGRTRERSQLVDALERSIGEPSTQLVTLIGAPGIGKTRLVDELFAYVEEQPRLIRWRRGRSLAYGEGVALWALGEMVKAEAGILESDAPAPASDKLARAVAAVVGEDRDRAWVTRHLRPLVGLESQQAAAAEDGRVEAFAAWRRFAEALAEDGATVLVFEDLHWADDALLDFVDVLAERAGGVPLLVVCTARPELLERRPTWGGGKVNSLSINLTPLSDDDTARLIAELLSQALLPAPMQAALLARAEGNPLYAQEYVRMLQDQGMLVRDAGGWRLDGEPRGLPESLQGIIAARLDTLSEDEKRFLQAAAVIGKTAWIGAACRITGRSPWEADELLHRLERKQVVTRARRSSVAGETEFSFAHALVQDVAYSQIPRAERAEKHEQAAGWIEQLAGERDDKAELLAHHYARSLEIRQQTGRIDSAVAGKAKVALIDAGRQALAVNAHDAAARHFEAALGLIDADDPARAPVLLDLGRARSSSGSADEPLLVAARDAQVAAGDCEGAAWAEYLLGLWAEDVAGDGERADAHYAMAAQHAARIQYRPITSLITYLPLFRLVVGSRPREAIALADAGLARADASGDLAARGLLLNMRGLARVSDGDERGIDDTKEAAAILARLAHPRAAPAYNNVAEIHRRLGYLEEAARTREEQRRWATRFGEANQLAVLDVEHGVDRYHAGSWDETLRVAAPYLGSSARVDEAAARLLLARVLAPRAGGGTSRADVMTTIEYGRESGNDELLLEALAMQATVCSLDGDPEGGRRALQEFLDVAQPLDGFPGSPSMLAEAALVADVNAQREQIAALLTRIPASSRWTRAIAATLDGRHAEAADRYREIGSRPLEAAAHLLAAEDAAADRRFAEAAAQARAALAFYEHVDARFLIGRAERLLQQTA
jgi:class 3 adenylate cyclase